MSVNLSRTVQCPGTIDCISDIEHQGVWHNKKYLFFLLRLVARKPSVADD
jgi:hypothetical protein